MGRGCRVLESGRDMTEGKSHKSLREEARALRAALHMVVDEDHELEEAAEAQKVYYEEADHVIRLRTRMECKMSAGQLTLAERKEMQMQIESHEAVMNSLSHRIEQLKSEAGLHESHAEETLGHLAAEAEWHHHQASLHPDVGHTAFANVKGFKEGVDKHGKEYSITSTFASHAYGAAETHNMVLDSRKKRESKTSLKHRTARDKWVLAVRELELFHYAEFGGKVGTTIEVERDWVGSQREAPVLGFDEIVKITPVIHG